MWIKTFKNEIEKIALSGELLQRTSFKAFDAGFKTYDKWSAATRLNSTPVERSLGRELAMKRLDQAHNLGRGSMDAFTREAVEIPAKARLKTAAHSDTKHYFSGIVSKLLKLKNIRPALLIAGGGLGALVGSKALNKKND
jgi:hypothetical protein